MKDKTQLYRKFLFFLLLIILVFPFFQKSLYLFKFNPLKGAVTLTSQDTFSISKWFSGEFQEKEEKYLNENFGFRNIFVRINNQILFNVFNIAKANGIVIGKQNYLYEEPYINAYLGKDFIGKDSISHIVSKLKYIQDTLSKLNKTFFIVYAPSKGTFFPEFFPEKYNENKKITNYEYFVELSNKNNLNYIDFNKYFIENKGKTKYPLFSKYGTHWSIYSGCLVSDSIIKYIEKKRNITMPHIYWTEINEEYSKESDIDIADGMNLLLNFKDEKMAYPKVLFKNDSNSQKPTVLVISDSFYWILYGMGISRAFSNDHFWYYNKEIYPKNAKSPYITDMITLKEEIAKYDVIIIMSTSPSLTRIGWGFIEDSYSFFKYGIDRNQLKEIISDICNNKEWMEQIKIKAIERNISIDEMILKDALWTINELNKKK